MGNSNVLKWTILNETDGYYDLERSGNAVDSYSIERIKSKGTSGTETNYSYEDRSPLAMSFYRLK